MEQIKQSKHLVTLINNRRDFLLVQSELNEKNRAILLGWLVSLSKNLNLSYATIFLGIQILDKYSAVKKISIKEYQLVGLASLFMAMKFEEVRAPRLKDIAALL